jgi:diketogulonate reductase-like aldo/keto reductase
MTPVTTPALTLNDGVTIPALGLGVFQSPPEETTAAVETALRGGYRLVDTAAAYDNEPARSSSRASTTRSATPPRRPAPTTSTPRCW